VFVDSICVDDIHLSCADDDVHVLRLQENNNIALQYDKVTYMTYGITMLNSLHCNALLMLS